MGLCIINQYNYIYRCVCVCVPLAKNLGTELSRCFRHFRNVFSFPPLSKVQDPACKVKFILCSLAYAYSRLTEYHRSLSPPWRGGTLKNSRSGKQISLLHFIKKLLQKATLRMWQLALHGQSVILAFMLCNPSQHWMIHVYHVRCKNNCLGGQFILLHPNISELFAMCSCHVLSSSNMHTGIPIPFAHSTLKGILYSSL